MIALLLAIPTALAVLFATGQFSRGGSKIGLDGWNGRATQTARTVYLACCSSAPGDNALGTEIAVSGYARQAVAWSAPTDADPPVAASSGVVTFTFTADPAAITHFALMDASTGGTAPNMLGYWTLDVAKDPAAGESLSVASAALTMSLT